MLFPTNNHVEATEEGTVSFVGANMYQVEWKFRGHVIRCVFKKDDRAFSIETAPKPGVKILYEDRDVSEKYLEYLNNLSDVHVRTTLNNIAVITDVIDKNLEDYIDKQN